VAARGAASSCIGFAWRGGGVLGAVRLFLSSSSWLLGGGSFSEVGGARHLARDRELLSDDLRRHAPSPRPDLKVVELALPQLRSCCLGVLSPSCPKWLAPRWPELGDLVGFLEKSSSTGSCFLVRSEVLFALLLDLVVISYFLRVSM
jgi:hypothetical protein